ncbi:MAG: hypothetical protein ACREL7_17030 [Longimicrobiales bacterium]
MAIPAILRSSVKRHICCIALVALAACEQSAATGADPFDIALPAPEVLVSLESELLGQPTDLEVDGSGLLWVADAANKRVVAIGEDGEVARTIGSEGEGPGEFQAPVTIAVNDTIVRVIESRLMRVQDYRPDGRHITDHVVPSQFLGAGALAIDGRLVLPSLGRDSALAHVRRVTDSTSIRLGPPVAPAPAGFDFAAMKAVIAEGRVPDEFRNSVTPVVGEDAIWLLVQSESEVRKYTPSGALAWNEVLQVPEIEHARREFQRKNAEEPNPARIYSLQAMVAAREVGDDLWILMLGATGADAVFYLLDEETGAMRGRLSVATPAPVSQFTVDPDRNRLYLAVMEEASILVVDLAGVDDRVLRGQ